MTTRRHFIILMALFLMAWVMTILLSRTALALEPYTATYKLSRGRFTVGETRYELKINEDREVLFHAHAETRGLISLFRNDEIMEQSRLKLDDEDRLIAMEYEYRHQRGDKIEEEKHIDFNWEEGIAVSRVDNETHELPLSPGVIDRMALQLRVMQDAMAGVEKTRMVYEAIDEDEIDTYEFTLEGEYHVTTGAGEFRAMRLERKHGSRTTIFWVAPALGYLPVKVEQRREDSATMRLELETISGPLVAEAGSENNAATAR